MVKKGKRVQEQTNYKYFKGTGKYFFKENFVWELLKFTHTKTHRIPNDKQKRRKNQIGNGKTMPFRMFERGIDSFPTARGIYQNHQGYGKPRQNVQGKVSVFPNRCGYGLITCHNFPEA
jgi:hypothetical protein